MPVQMGAQADTSICRGDAGALEWSGDLIIDGMSAKDMMKTIKALVETVEGLKKRLAAFEKNDTGL